MLKNKDTVMRHLDNEVLKRKNNPYDVVNYEFFQDKKYDLHRNDEDVVRKAVSIHPKCISFSELKNDREFVLDATKNIDCYTFTYANNKFREDKEIVQSAMEHKPHMYSFIEGDLKNDKEFALEAISKRGLNLEYVPEDLRSDKKFVLEAVKNEPRAFQYASNGIKEEIGDREPVRSLESMVQAEKLQCELSQKSSLNQSKKMKI